MADPGFNTSRETGFDAFEAWTYSESLCWSKPMNVAVDELIIEDVQKLESSKVVIDSKQLDVDQDDRPDIFRLVETEKSYLLFFHRGYTHHKAWANCGGGRSYEKGIENRGWLLGAIDKEDGDIVRKALGIDFQSITLQSKNKYEIIVRGVQILNGYSENKTWIFSPVDCPQPMEWHGYLK